MKPLSKAMIFIIVLVCSAIAISAIVIPIVIFVIKPAAEAAEAEAAQNGEHYGNTGCGVFKRGIQN